MEEERGGMMSERVPFPPDGMQHDVDSTGQDELVMVSIVVGMTQGWQVRPTPTPPTVHVRDGRGGAARAQGIQRVITVAEVKETVPATLLTEVLMMRLVERGRTPTPFCQEERPTEVRLVITPTDFPWG